MSNSLVCPGDACPLRYTCERFHAWIDTDDADNLDKAVDTFCKNFGKSTSFSVSL